VLSCPLGFRRVKGGVANGVRQVIKFRLVAVEGDEDLSRPPPLRPQRRRVIPTSVKVEVWKRDGGSVWFVTPSTSFISTMTFHIRRAAHR